MAAEFDAALAAEERADGTAEQPTFALAGEQFTCAPARLSSWVVLKLQAADEDHRTESAQAIITFFRHVVAPDDWRRFETAAEDADLDAFKDAINEIIEAYAGRPTRRSTGSPAGPSSTGRSSTPGSSKPRGPVRGVPSSRAKAS